MIQYIKYLCVMIRHQKLSRLKLTVVPVKWLISLQSLLIELRVNLFLSPFTIFS